MGFKAVEEDEYGLYAWRLANGKFYGDEDGNIMNIPSKKYDLHKISQLQQAARAEGVEEGGSPVFLSARRRVTMSEYEDQKARLMDGLIADPYDYNAQKEEFTHGRNGN